MFTGIIETLGTVRKKVPSRQGLQLTIEPDLKWSDVQLGESISVNGVCLTVSNQLGHVFTADVSPETISRTSLRGFVIGTRVNLERALKPTDRLGGHIVTGHIDTCGVIATRQDQADFTIFSVKIPEPFGKYLIEKGSVAVDGISLTVNTCTNTMFLVSIIPFTANHTTMGLRREGDTVNLEFDVIAKYLEKLSAPRFQMDDKCGQKDKINLDFLAKHGIV